MENTFRVKKNLDILLNFLKENLEEESIKELLISIIYDEIIYERLKALSYMQYIESNTNVSYNESNEQLFRRHVFSNNFSIDDIDKFLIDNSKDKYATIKLINEFKNESDLVKSSKLKDIYNVNYDKWFKRDLHIKDISKDTNMFIAQQESTPYTFNYNDMQNATAGQIVHVSVKEGNIIQRFELIEKKSKIDRLNDLDGPKLNDLYISMTTKYNNLKNYHDLLKLWKLLRNTIDIKTKDVKFYMAYAFKLINKNVSFYDLFTTINNEHKDNPQSLYNIDNTVNKTIYSKISNAFDKTDDNLLQILGISIEEYKEYKNNNELNKIPNYNLEPLKTSELSIKKNQSYKYITDKERSDINKNLNKLSEITDKNELILKLKNLFDNYKINNIKIYNEDHKITTDFIKKFLSGGIQKKFI